jgi:hypothetical protein
MTDPKKLAEDIRRLSFDFSTARMDRDWSGIDRLGKELEAAIDQLSALAEKAEMLEAALQSCFDRALGLDPFTLKQARAALSTGEPK